MLFVDFFPNLAYKNPAQQSMVIFRAIVGYIFSESDLDCWQTSQAHQLYSIVYHSVVAHTD